MTAALAWLDLETTGLDPETDSILQLALVVTDDHLNELDHLCLDLHASPVELSDMDPVVVEMHTKTGLLDRVRKSDWIPSAVEEVAVNMLKHHFGEDTHPPITLCGSSVHFDRGFLRHQMRQLDREFHHRLLDVSAFKIAVNLWAPSRKFDGDRSGKHDALFDIRSSIEELRHYLSVFGISIYGEGRHED